MPQAPAQYEGQVLPLPADTLLPGGGMFGMPDFSKRQKTKEGDKL